MLLSLFLIFLGLLFLYVGAEWLIKASASLAIKWGVTPLLVGLTIIGYGTSTPELIVNLDALWKSYNSLAMGNLVGSNLFNMAFILALSLLIRPITISSSARWLDIPFMGLSCLFLFFIGLHGSINRYMGLILVILLTTYTYITYKKAKKDHQLSQKQEPTFPTWQVKKIFFMFPLSFLFLAIGANILIDGAIDIAKRYSINEALIGFTLVAIGTSLPELATSILAMAKRHEDIAVGNILGSNIYNVMGILGIMAIIRPITFTGISLTDLSIMLGTNLFFCLYIFIYPRIGRIAGFILLVSYLSYTIWLF